MLDSNSILRILYVLFFVWLLFLQGFHTVSYSCRELLGLWLYCIMCGCNHTYHLVISYWPWLCWLKGRLWMSGWSKFMCLQYPDRMPESQFWNQNWNCCTECLEWETIIFWKTCLYAYSREACTIPCREPPKSKSSTLVMSDFSKFWVHKELHSCKQGYLGCSVADNNFQFIFLVHDASALRLIFLY